MRLLVLASVLASVSAQTGTLTLSLFCTAILANPQTEPGFGYIQHLSYQARLVVKPRDAVVESGGKISFFCRADGNPVPTVTWKINDQHIAEARYVVKTSPEGLSTLRIEPIRAESDNNTLVSCAADNGVGLPVIHAARLSVLNTEDLPEGFPIIEKHPRLKAVEKGRTAQVTCMVQGEPRPEVFWLRDLLPINIGSTSRYTMATLGNPAFEDYAIGSLMISNSDEKDEGKYECVARNEHGLVHSKAAHLYVKVRRVPPHFSIPPKRIYKVMQGGSVNLTCVAVGYPMPKVFWRRGFHDDLDEPGTAPVGRNVLLLKELESTENYTCIAVSKLGNIEAVATVQVKAIPPGPTNLRILDVAANSVRLSWNSVQPEKGDKIEHYIVEYRPKYAEGSDFLESEPEKGTTLTIRGLEPFEEYELRVTAVNLIGRGRPSLPVEVQTKEARPDTPPLKVQARSLSQSSAMVQWEAPEKPNGAIKEYRVFYTLKPGDPFPMWRQVVVEDGRTVTLPGLDPDQTYTIRVQPINNAGAGPLSDPATVITKPGSTSLPQLHPQGYTFTHAHNQRTPSLCLYIDAYKSRT